MRCLVPWQDGRLARVGAGRVCGYYVRARPAPQAATARSALTRSQAHQADVSAAGLPNQEAISDRPLFFRRLSRRLV